MVAAPDRASKRICLLTGAAGKLGTSFCRLYARSYRIAAVYHSRPLSVVSQWLKLVDPLDPGAALVENEHPVFAIQADLSRPSAPQDVVDQTLERFGTIDLLVNAAVCSVWSPMLSSSRLADSAAGQFQINATVPLELALAAARASWNRPAEVNRAHNCNVVNVSSIAGINIYEGSGQSVYAASKAALNHLSRHMASEFKAMGVRVNAIAPNSFPKIVSTASVAGAIVTLDQGDMTGQVLVLDAARPTGHQRET